MLHVNDEVIFTKFRELSLHEDFGIVSRARLQVVGGFIVGNWYVCTCVHMGEASQPGLGNNKQARERRINRGANVSNKKLRDR